MTGWLAAAHSQESNPSFTASTTRSSSPPQSYTFSHSWIQRRQHTSQLHRFRAHIDPPTPLPPVPNQSQLVVAHRRRDSAIRLFTAHLPLSARLRCPHRLSLVRSWLWQQLLASSIAFEGSHIQLLVRLQHRPSHLPAQPFHIATHSGDPSSAPWRRESCKQRSTRP